MSHDMHVTCKTIKDQKLFKVLIRVYTYIDLGEVECGQHTFKRREIQNEYLYDILSTYTFF